MKYGVAIFPSKELQDKANAMRKRYDSHYSLISPHVTLKETFTLTALELQPVVDQLREIAKELKPFSLIVYKYSSFSPTSNSIYMGVQENEELLKLQKKLNNDTLAQKEPYPFVPHITIGQDLNDDEFHDILGRLKMKDIHHEEVCDRFQLLYELDNGSWTVYETFVLGKEL